MFDLKIEELTEDRANSGRCCRCCRDGSKS